MPSPAKSESSNPLMRTSTIPNSTYGSSSDGSIGFGGVIDNTPLGVGIERGFGGAFTVVFKSGGAGMRTTTDIRAIGGTTPSLSVLVFGSFDIAADGGIEAEVAEAAAGGWIDDPLILSARIAGRCTSRRGNRLCGTYGDVPGVNEGLCTCVSSPSKLDVPPGRRSMADKGWDPRHQLTIHQLFQVVHTKMLSHCNLSSLDGVDISLDFSGPPLPVHFLSPSARYTS